MIKRVILKPIVFLLGILMFVNSENVRVRFFEPATEYNTSVLWGNGFTLLSLILIFTGIFIIMHKKER